MTWRGIKARYAQSVLGIGWAVFQPVVTMIIYTIIFSRVAKISLPGNLPYSLVAFCGIVPWLFFSTGLTGASNSLVQNNSMVSKIYFPRIILPLSQILSKFVDLGIMGLLLGLLMIGYKIAGYDFAPRPEAAVVVPAMILLAFVAVLGMSLWLAAMAVQYRDVAYALTFVIQLAMYITPVIYTTEMIPGRLMPIFGLNPMLAVITGVRASLLGAPFEYHLPLILEGTLVATTLLVTGLFYFRRSERLFADVA
ncbi:ABC transporter permease [Tautonia sp. JC769]|uniref:ABC transporter permease n=1 Tax=Tautonia sp. JC769 TaxID=3232135 RepID=UPI003458C867